MPKRAILYARTSYADREQISQPAQLDLCRQYAQERGRARDLVATARELLEELDA